MNDTQVKAEVLPKITLLFWHCSQILGCSQRTKISLCLWPNYFVITAIDSSVRIATLTKANLSITILERSSRMWVTTDASITCQGKFWCDVMGFSTKTSLVPSWHRGFDVIHQIFIKFYHCSSFSLPTSSHVSLGFFLLPSKPSFYNRTYPLKQMQLKTHSRNILLVLMFVYTLSSSNYFIPLTSSKESLFWTGN